VQNANAQSCGSDMAQKPPPVRSPGPWIAAAPLAGYLGTACNQARLRRDGFSPSLFKLLTEHDLFKKRVPTTGSVRAGFLGMMLWFAGGVWKGGGERQPVTPQPPSETGQPSVAEGASIIAGWMNETLGAPLKLARYRREARRARLFGRRGHDSPAGDRKGIEFLAKVGEQIRRRST
jgi:hypothetical protein